MIILTDDYGKDYQVSNLEAFKKHLKKISFQER